MMYTGPKIPEAAEPMPEVVVAISDHYDDEVSGDAVIRNGR